MKRQDFNSYDGQNWAWPQKTWFQERLSAIKAREQDSRRRPMPSSQKPTVIESKANGEKSPEER